MTAVNWAILIFCIVGTCTLACIVYNKRKLTMLFMALDIVCFIICGSVVYNNLGIRKVQMSYPVSARSYSSTKFYNALFNGGELCTMQLPSSVIKNIPNDNTFIILRHLDAVSKLSDENTKGVYITVSIKDESFKDFLGYCFTGKVDFLYTVDINSMQETEKLSIEYNK